MLHRPEWHNREFFPVRWASRNDGHLSHRNTTTPDECCSNEIQHSLQLQRTEISCKKNFHFQNFRRLFFSRLQKKFRFHPQKILTTFFFSSHFLLSYVSTLPNAAGKTAQTYFLHHSFSKSFTLFTILFFSTVPLLNLQLQLHNSHFTTANYILQLHKLSLVAR